MRYLGWSWWLGVVLAVCAASSGRAYASCAGSSPVELLWSYPADGDSDVPTNAQLQLVFNAKLFGTDWDATLNGEPVDRAPDGTFAFGTLAADTAYTFRLDGHQPRESIALTVVELHFRTGSASADAVQAPTVVGQGQAEQGACERVDARYYCRDTPPTDVHEIELDEANAVAWIDDEGNVWPRGCYPRVDLIHADGQCYNMHAVSADGQVSEATPFCEGKATTKLVQSQSVEPSAQASSSCAVAATGGGSRLPAVLLLSLVLSRWRRRTRSAR